ncbi:MAG: hypothetical protein ACT4P6_13550 [Gemmatimonadaceae bacterium]
MTSRIKTVIHRGRAILICDYSELTAANEWQELMLAEHKAMAAEPLNSVRSLSILTGSRLSPEVISTMKAVTQKNKPYVKVRAIVGLSALQRVVDEYGAPLFTLFSHRLHARFAQPTGGAHMFDMGQRHAARMVRAERRRSKSSCRSITSA